MPQIDFFLLSRFSSVLLAVVLTVAFLLVNYVMLKKWIKSSIKIAFMVTLINDLRFVKAHISQAVSQILLFDFLEQFIFVFNPIFASSILLVVYLLIVSISAFG